MVERSASPLARFCLLQGWLLGVGMALVRRLHVCYHARNHKLVTCRSDVDEIAKTGNCRKVVASYAAEHGCIPDVLQFCAGVDSV